MNLACLKCRWSHFVKGSDKIVDGKRVMIEGYRICTKFPQVHSDGFATWPHEENVHWCGAIKEDGTWDARFSKEKKC